MSTNMTKLLVQQLKGYSFRLLNLEDGQIYRALRQEFPDLTPGELLTVTSFETSGDLVEELEVVSITAPNTSKKRIKVSLSEFKVGDLVDGAPILGLGQSFYEDGEKKAYAYFSVRK